MKTRAMKLTAVVMMVMVSMSAYSQTNGGINKGKVLTSMMLKGENKVELRITKPAETVLTLNVYDKYNTKVFSTRINKENDLLLTHNIAEFPAGVYTYEIREGKNVVSETSIVKSSGKALEYAPVERLASTEK